MFSIVLFNLFFIQEWRTRHGMGVNKPHKRVFNYLKTKKWDRFSFWLNVCCELKEDCSWTGSGWGGNAFVMTGSQICLQNSPCKLHFFKTQPSMPYCCLFIHSPEKWFCCKSTCRILSPHTKTEEENENCLLNENLSICLLFWHVRQ